MKLPAYLTVAFGSAPNGVSQDSSSFEKMMLVSLGGSLLGYISIALADGNFSGLEAKFLPIIPAITLLSGCAVIKGIEYLTERF